MKLLSVVHLLLPLSACLAAVVTDFTNVKICKDFFPTLNGVTAPTRFNNTTRHKQICQTLNNVTEFATYYDTTNKIPVYSVYKFTRRGNCKRKTGDWFIEPQLDNRKLGCKMATEATVPNNIRGTHQALNGDYNTTRNNISYHKGHLVPVYHANNQSCADATFTLTNAAPQEGSFNQRWFHAAEKKVADFLTTYCTNVGLSAYVVTGVVPGNDILNYRVLIPSHYWTAYCCFDSNNKPKHSGGYYGENISGGTVYPSSVQALQNNLTSWYNTAFTVFGGVC